MKENKRKESENLNVNDLASFFFARCYYSELCGVHVACVSCTHTCQSLLPSCSLFIFTQTQHSAQHFCFVVVFGERITASTIAYLEFQQFHFISTLNHMAASASENSKITGQRPWRKSVTKESQLATRIHKSHALTSSSRFQSQWNETTTLPNRWNGADISEEEQRWRRRHKMMQRIWNEEEEHDEKKTKVKLFSFSL